jgi:hypothetical protein
VNFTLLLPSALAALSALALPLLIHLSRRSEQRITDFAALRWLSAKLRPRRKIVFQEILLLLLRLFFLAMLALFLAKPVSRLTASSSHWVMVIPGADIRTVKKSFAEKNMQWHWLTPGFPEYKNTPDTTKIPVASLLRELDAQLPTNTRVTIFAPEVLSGLDGDRIRLSRKVDWQVTPGRMPSSDTTEASTPIHLAIRHDENHADAVIYFRAAFSAWESSTNNVQNNLLDDASIASALNQKTNSLIWLASGELPKNIRDWVAQGGTVIVTQDCIFKEAASSVVAWRNPQGQALARISVLGRGRIVQWQQALSPSAMPALLEPTFPEQLKQLLRPTTVISTRALANAQTPFVGIKPWPGIPQSLQPWLILIITLLFMLERWLANAPRRWSAT